MASHLEIVKKEVKGAKLKKARDSPRKAFATMKSHIMKMGFIIAKVKGKVDDATTTIEELRLGMEELWEDMMGTLNATVGELDKRNDSFTCHSHAQGDLEA